MNALSRKALITGSANAIPLWADPSRTMLGAPQERWLNNGLGTSTERWQVLANQVMVAPYDSMEGNEQRVSMDQWSGYPVARDRLLWSIAQRAPNRTVVLTRDIHSSWVNELRTDFRRPEQPAIAAEFVGTSISSGGDGGESTILATPAARADNPISSGTSTVVATLSVRWIRVRGRRSIGRSRFSRAPALRWTRRRAGA